MFIPTRLFDVLKCMFLSFIIHYKKVDYFSVSLTVSKAKNQITDFA